MGEVESKIALAGFEAESRLAVGLDLESETGRLPA